MYGLFLDREYVDLKILIDICCVLFLAELLSLCEADLETLRGSAELNSKVHMVIQELCSVD